MSTPGQLAMLGFLFAYAPIYGIHLFGVSHQRLKIPFQLCVALIHMATPDGYAAARLGNELGLPVVCSLRGSDINVAPKTGRLIRRLTISALRNADRITAVSGALRREARQLVPREIEVDYTGLDTARFRPDPETRAAIRAQMKIDDRTCVFGLVANLIREKGVYELLHAFERVVSAGRNSALWLVGDGHEGARLRSIVDQRGLRDRVHFTGRVSHDRVAGLLNAIDVNHERRGFRTRSWRR